MWIRASSEILELKVKYLSVSELRHLLLNLMLEEDS